MRRDSAPRRGEIKAVAALTANGVGTCGADDNQAQAGHLIAGTLNANGKAAGSATQQDAEAGLLVVHGTQDPGTSKHLAFALGRNNGQENAIFSLQDISGRQKAQNGKGWNADGTSYTVDTVATQGVAVAYSTKLHHTSACGAGKLYDEHTASLDACSPPPALLIPSQVRKLTPKECERLQGMPDDYTLVPWRGKPIEECPDGPRYRAIGNSWAVPVARWVGMRVMRQLGLDSESALK